ncbi:hypothetical protein IFM89_023684 [Coptis chinensis]|uniref:RRM domain-containing protein n=1 Tax=Coptis chinensis TaxID=261450 RepID=A0A835H2A0_9MAGN|nr:hypothetical protein IFM89_023684 [Coptis chinensis]
MIISDHETGRSRGFGFVTFSSEQAIRRFSGLEAKSLGLVSRVFDSKEVMYVEVRAVAELPQKAAMYGRDLWGGPLEINAADSATDDDWSRNLQDFDKAALSWPLDDIRILYYQYTLKEFIGFAEREVTSLTLLYAGVGRNADVLALYFGEDLAATHSNKGVLPLLMVLLKKLVQMEIPVFWQMYCFSIHLLVLGFRIPVLGRICILLVTEELVEHLVREEKTMGAYDLIDIYCELIVARLPIIESQNLLIQQQPSNLDKDRELAEANAEIKALRLSERLREKAVEEEGVDIVSKDEEALLLFSGGETRKDAGPRSEAQSYWAVVESKDWFGEFVIVF